VPGKAPHVMSEQTHRENWEWAERELSNLQALVRDRAELVGEFSHVTSVAAGATVATRQSLSRPATRDGVIEAFYVFIGAKSGTADPTLRIYNESSGSPIAVTDEVIIVQANKTYEILPRKRGVNKGDVFGLRCTTDGDGAIGEMCGCYRMRGRWETA
jgi:hypothetical protein